MYLKHVMHRRRYVHCVGLSFLKLNCNSLTSAHNSCIFTVNLSRSYMHTINLSILLRAKKPWKKS